MPDCPTYNRLISSWHFSPSPFSPLYTGNFPRRNFFLGPGIPLHHFALYPGPGSSAHLTPLERERLERLGIPPPPGPPGPPGSAPGHPHHPAHAAQLEAAERLALATDPMVNNWTITGGVKQLIWFCRFVYRWRVYRRNIMRTHTHIRMRTHIYICIRNSRRRRNRRPQRRRLVSHYRVRISRVKI